MKTNGKIVLSGFKLEPSEKAIVENLIKNYKKKIEEKVKYSEIRLIMKKALRGKAFLHEIHGTMMAGKRFSAKAKDYNLFAAISETLDKLKSEAFHAQRTIRQTNRQKRLR